MIGMPPRDFGGTSVLPSADIGFSRTPNIRGIDGPVMSPSSTPTLKPRRFRPTASRPATRDFPTPPFPDMTAMTCLTPFCSAMPRGTPFAASDGAGGAPSGSLPVSANTLSSPIRSSSFTRPAPCPAAACAIVSLLLIAHDAQPSVYRAKMRAESGQRSTTEAMVMSGVI